MRNEELDTYPLVVDDDNFLHMAKATELLVEVTLHGANAQTEYTKYAGRIRRLLRKVSIQHRVVSKEKLTTGAWGGLLDAGEDLRKESLPGLRERERPLGAAAASLSRDSDTGAAGGGASL